MVAQYILKKLHLVGLTEARLEKVKVNKPFPDQFEPKLSDSFCLNNSLVI